MKNNSENGFSYIDVMCAIVILVVGILALLSAITSAVVQSASQQQQLAARQIASSTIESIMSAKETSSGTLGWSRVGNVGSNPDVNGNMQGIFLTGNHQVRNDAGPDRIVGTADDTGGLVGGFQRQIVITDQCDPDRPSPNCPTPGTYAVRIRSIQVTISYFVGSIQRQEQLTTVLTDYATTN